MKPIAKLAAAAALAVAAGPVAAQVLTFDDVTSSTRVPVPNGYGGFEWQNLEVLNTAIHPASGYVNGVVSGDYVAYNVWGGPATIVSTGDAFTLGSGYFTGAWNDGLQILVEGFGSGPSPLYSATFEVSTNGPILQTFNWQGLSSVRFSASGGTNSPYGFSGTQFALDNLSFGVSSAVPEPSTWAFMILGFGTLGGMMRANRRRVPMTA